MQVAEKVASGHSDKEPRLEEVATICKTLAEELLHHADDEENELFPAILAGKTDIDVARYVDDHEAVGAQLARIRELTDGHAAPEWACNTTLSLYHSLAELEQDIHQHVHKENNVLFPRLE